ncbi:MAG: hypothetical protein U0174_00350 [Polyangiaceae bacterium]
MSLFMSALVNVREPEILRYGAFGTEPSQYVKLKRLVAMSTEYCWSESVHSEPAGPGRTKPPDAFAASFVTSFGTMLDVLPSVLVQPGLLRLWSVSFPAEFRLYEYAP